MSAASAAAAARAAAAKVRARQRQQQAQAHANRKATTSHKPTVRKAPTSTFKRRYRAAPGWGAVRITCDDPKLDLNVVMGASPPMLTGGFGGWELVERPRQVSMTNWKGVEPFQLSLNVMFEGFIPTATQWGHPEGIGMEDDIYELMRAAHGDDDTPPGVCRIYGVQLPADRWVIEDISFDADSAIVRTSDRQRLRQGATITFREYVPPEYLRVSKSALQGAKPKTKIITTKKGDTPAKVAHRAHCKWTDLRKLNPKIVKKANQHLKTGTKLRVPIAQTKASKKKARPKSGKTAHAGRQAKKR